MWPAQLLRELSVLADTQQYQSLWFSLVTYVSSDPSLQLSSLSKNTPQAAFSISRGLSSGVPTWTPYDQPRHG